MTTSNSSTHVWPSLGEVASVRRYRLSEAGTLVSENIWDFCEFKLRYSEVDLNLPSVSGAFGSEEEMLYGTSVYDATQADVIRNAVSDRRGPTEPRDSA